LHTIAARLSIGQNLLVADPFPEDTLPVLDVQFTA
jgi:hypothetical protein